MGATTAASDDSDDDEPAFPKDTGLTTTNEEVTTTVALNTTSTEPAAGIRKYVNSVQCVCKDGWERNDCSALKPDFVEALCSFCQRPESHGDCHMGLCFCDVGYSGKHCLTECPKRCTYDTRATKLMAIVSRANANAAM